MSFLRFLQSRGFDAVLLDEGSFAWNFAGLAIPIRLQVPEEHREAAMSCLDDADSEASLGTPTPMQRPPPNHALELTTSRRTNLVFRDFYPFHPLPHASSLVAAHLVLVRCYGKRRMDTWSTADNSTGLLFLCLVIVALSFFLLCGTAGRAPRPRAVLPGEYPFHGLVGFFRIWSYPTFVPFESQSLGLDASSGFEPFYAVRHHDRFSVAKVAFPIAYLSHDSNHLTGDGADHEPPYDLAFRDYYPFTRRHTRSRSWQLILFSLDSSTP